jgi:hypothetical protein
MEPGNGHDQFCMPTAVAVSESTGDFFVADGYCNSRVMKFNKEGKLIKIISKKKCLLPDCRSKDINNRILTIYVTVGPKC